MRQNRIGIIGCLAFLLVLFGASGWAAAAPVNTCNAGVFVVDAGNADLVSANGYSNALCNLQINATLPSASMAVNLTLNAKSVTIGSLATPVSIINDSLNSGIRITAANGNISLVRAIVKAHKLLNFKCSSPGVPGNCTFTSSDQSEIVAAGDFANLGSFGTLIIDVEGDVNITGTKIHGGDEFKVLSANGNITVGPCGGGTVGVCTDPLVSKTPQAVTAQCFDAAGNFIGCTVTFTTANQLRDVCFPSTPGVPCNGGFKEKRFEAKRGFIDVHGTSIESHEHMTFWCGPGGFKGADSTLTSKTAELVIDCSFNGGGAVDLTNADISGANGVSVKSGVANTITACGATFEANGASDPPPFPIMNGGTTPFAPFYPRVLYGPFSIAGGPFNNATPAVNTCPGDGATFD